jgi:catechol 2,3-dioxygenase
MIKLLSQLTHVEIYATDMDASVRYYEQVLGLRVLERAGSKVYLRAWGDYYPYSVVLVPGGEPGLAMMAWRTSSAEALDEAVRRVEDSGHSGKWLEPGARLGRSYVFTGPYGHTIQLFWDVEQYKAEGALRSQYPDRPEKRSSHGVAPRHLDHVTVAARDVTGFCEWYRDILGFRIMAYAELPQGNLTFFGVLTTNEKSHDLGVLLDASDRPGRVHHYAFWVDTGEDLKRGAQLLIENGTPIEFGPGVHGIGEQEFLYFRDPSRLRVEINSGGYRNYVPDWQPHRWTLEEGPNDLYRNVPLPQTMLEAFPPAPEPTATEQGIVPGTEDELIARGALHEPKGIGSD